MIDDPNLNLTGDLVRPYVITNGRELPYENAFSLTTLVTATQAAQHGRVLAPESKRVLELCSGGFLSVAEVAAHAALPLGIIRILLAELTDNGLISSRAPIPAAQRTDEKLLQDVLSGLKARFGA